MVATVNDSRGKAVRLVLTPYHPVSRVGSITLFALVSAPILLVAFLCGPAMWYVLPFSLFVIALLGLGLTIGYRRLQIREEIRVAGTEIVIERGHHRPEQRYAVPLAAARVIFDTPRPDRHGHVFVRAGNSQVELGAFLDDTELGDLASRLARLLAA